MKNKNHTKQGTMKKVIFILLILSLALACTMSNQASNASQADPTVLQGSAPIALTSSPTPEAIRIPTPIADACKVNTGIEGGTVNIRTCAGTTCSVLAVVTEGESLDIVTSGEWMNVATSSGVTGWINSKYCMAW